FADGSFRDGVKVLEGIVLSAKGKKITSVMLESLYHTNSIDTDVKNMLLLLKNHDTKAALAIVQKLLEQGTDMKYFLEQLLVFLHQLLLIKVGVSEEKDMDDIDLEAIKKLVTVFSKAHGEIKSAVLPQLPLEMAIVEWGQPLTVIPASEPESRKITTEMLKPVQHDKEIKDDKAFFYKLLDQIKGEHHMLAGVLRSCVIHQKGDGEIVIEAPSSFHQQRVADKKALDFLEKVCEDITGKKTMISVVLKS
ncbi:MAG: hypothetical protein KBD46_02340, partial [Candidatus Levybacteria bacterium]|nr:hypothetical protein [Candidatus Levybacteria bacterium]